MSDFEHMGLLLPPEIWYAICDNYLLDGRYLTRLASVSPALRQYIHSVPVFKRAIDMHMIWLEDYVEEVDQHIERDRLAKRHRVLYNSSHIPGDYLDDIHKITKGLEGLRFDVDIGYLYMIYDFYFQSHASSMYSRMIELSGCKKAVQFKLIMYNQLEGDRRHHLPGSLGTIHRGACLWIKVKI